MIVLLTVLSALAVVAFFGVVIAYLIAIVDRLDRIGGSPTSFLAKITLGVRAIETETGALAPQVIQLNDGLSTIEGGLKVIDQHLVAAFTAIGEQVAGNA
ncbi:MAG: hypothetical protein ABIP13_06480 [Tepidiformaceae bacterium]